MASLYQRLLRRGQLTPEQEALGQEPLGYQTVADMADQVAARFEAAVLAAGPDTPLSLEEQMAIDGQIMAEMRPTQEDLRVLAADPALTAMTVGELRAAVDSGVARWATDKLGFRGEPFDYDDEGYGYLAPTAEGFLSDNAADLSWLDALAENPQAVQRYLEPRDFGSSKTSRPDELLPQLLEALADTRLRQAISQAHNEILRPYNEAQKAQQKEAQRLVTEHEQADNRRRVASALEEFAGRPVLSGLGDAAASREPVAPVGATPALDR
jgi:hypothetical protein